MGFSEVFEVLLSLCNLLGEKVWEREVKKYILYFLYIQS